MSSDPTGRIEFTPSDFVGAVKQGAEEVHRYLANTPIHEINVPVVQAHLERLSRLIAHVAPATQEGAGRSHEDGRGEAVRPNGRSEVHAR